jgi:hypothetical protein
MRLIDSSKIDLGVAGSSFRELKRSKMGRFVGSV